MKALISLTKSSLFSREHLEEQMFDIDKRVERDVVEQLLTTQALKTGVPIFRSRWADDPLNEQLLCDLRARDLHGLGSFRSGILSQFAVDGGVECNQVEVSYLRVRCHVGEHAFLGGEGELCVFEAAPEDREQFPYCGGVSEWSAAEGQARRVGRSSSMGL